MWRRRKPEPPVTSEAVLTKEDVAGIITMLMRIDANVQLLLQNEEDDGKEED